MIDLLSVSTENDFTTDEKELIQLHINSSSLISWETMQSAWRDNDGNLCIKYSKILGYESQWYHYNTTRKEWW